MMHALSVYTCACTRICMYVYVCTFVCTCHTCMLVYARVCRYACTKIRMIPCMHIQVGGIEDVWFRCMYVCVHTCICTYVCVRVFYVYAEC
jgi:hypothetical protein